jgi:hypothetical protein
MGASAPIISSNVIFMGNHSKQIDALGISVLSADASSGCDSVELTVHTPAENFSTGYIEASFYVPTPSTGQGWNQEGDHTS